MTIRAGVVREDPMLNGIHIAVGRMGGDVVQVVTAITAESPSHAVIDEFADPPTLFLPDDVARALLDALARHYGATGDARTLRKDYEAERARVDRLIAALVSAA